VTDIHKAAQLLSSLGAAKGGKATAAKLSPEERSASASKAAKARWAKQRAEKLSSTESSGTTKTASFSKPKDH
jgi:hypothetical protein